MLKYKKPKTIRELITVTLNHFAEDPVNRRCISIEEDYSSSQCYYSPTSLPNPHPTNIGCAIGMWLSKKNKQLLDKQCYELDQAGFLQVLEHEGRNLLPKWMLNVDSQLLSDLQTTHDTATTSLMFKKRLDNMLHDYYPTLDNKI